MGKAKISIEQFKEEVFNLTNGEFEILSEEIINSKKPLKIKHLKCNYIYYVSRDQFLRGNRCPECSKRRKRTTEEVRKMIFEKVGNEFTMLSEYLANTKPFLIQHNVCGHIYETTFNRFFHQGSRCFKCYHNSRNITLTNDEYRKLVWDTYGKEYSILGNYINKTTKISTKHNICNYVWDIDPYHFIDELNGCPICNKIAKEESKYIKIIIDFLNKKQIPFVREKKLFKNPKTKRYLRADFFLPDYNVIIEYDGKQHYKKMFNNSEKLLKQQERDLLKNNWCKENNIKLLRIPYTIYKAEDIKDKIKKFIKTISSQT
jgi:very-short-patch-repair endonuclease/uncharacterized protein YozE (UPF0346 family)